MSDHTGCHESKDRLNAEIARLTAALAEWQEAAEEFAQDKAALFTRAEKAESALPAARQEGREEGVRQGWKDAAGHLRTNCFGRFDVQMVASELDAAARALPGAPETAPLRFPGMRCDHLDCPPDSCRNEPVDRLPAVLTFLRASAKHCAGRGLEERASSLTAAADLIATIGPEAALRGLNAFPRGAPETKGTEGGRESERRIEGTITGGWVGPGKARELTLSFDAIPLELPMQLGLRLGVVWPAPVSPERKGDGT